MTILRVSLAIAALLFAATCTQAQQWCAYNPVRDTQLNCGYSSEHACEKATKDSHGACTVDPFYD
jgi:hypothetical protein